MKSTRTQSKAFTLIELLIVIAIVAVLISMLLPALSRCRAAAKKTRELNTSRQMITATMMYANDAKGEILPGYARQQWVNGPMNVVNHAGERLTNEAAQRFPWRLAPYLGQDFRGLYDDVRVLADLKEREAEYSGYGVNYDYVISLFPSLSMNVNFIGGNDRNGMFDPLFQRVFGRVYLTKFEQSIRPSEVLAFVSARAEPQPAVPIVGQPEGFFRVEPPIFTAAQGRRWGGNTTGYEIRTTDPNANSGFVSLRHGGKAVGVHLDGHATMLGWPEVSDMRRWADQATNPDWGLIPRT
jgi:prepilin-type N-terminal cleavage/methylation domain-containing protein